MRFTIKVTDPKFLDLFEAVEQKLKEFGETELIEDYALKHGLSIPDGFVKSPVLSTGYACQAKRQINSQTLPAIISRLKDLASKVHLKPLLVTDYVNPNLSEECKSQGVAYIDRAGNALLVDPPLFVSHRGFKPIDKPSRPTRAFQATGLRLIAFLLKTPDAINWSYRQLAVEAGLSLGSISRILSDLRSLGFVRLVGPSHNALINRQNLFEQWELGYMSRLRPNLEPRSFRQADGAPIEQIQERLSPSMRSEILLGGELAAAIATQHLRPQSVTLHVRPHRPLLPLVKDLRLIPDRQGNVTVMQQLGAPDTWRWESMELAHLVHPLLVHAELLQGRTDDRLRETARIIYDQYLSPILSIDETQTDAKRDRMP